MIIRNAKATVMLSGCSIYHISVALNMKPWKFLIQLSRLHRSFYNRLSAAAFDDLMGRRGACDKDDGYDGDQHFHQ